MLLWPLRGTGPSPYADNVRRNLFAFVKGNKTVIFIVVSLFSAMHLNELNTILKYGRRQMREKNKCNAPLSCCCCFSQPQTAAILTADVQ